MSRRMLLIAFLTFSHLAFSQSPTPFQAPAGLSYTPNLEYSNVGGKLEMDILRPQNLSGLAPAVLFIHGGGFRAGNRQSYLALAAKLAQRGYVTATASYRLAPRNQFPSGLEDAKAAVRYLRANAAKYGIDPEHIAAWGGSAGGHLVLMLGLTGDVAEFEGTGPNREFSSKVQCVVNYYGPTDFTQSYSKSVDAAQVLPLWMGGHLDQNRKIHQKASPINWVTPNAAPTISIHGTKDTYVAYEHSVAITERLLNAGVDAEMETISGAGHGFKGADAERAETVAFAFLDKQFKTVIPQTRLLLSDHGVRGEILSMDWPSGKVYWTKKNGRGHDVQSLANGHVLFTIAPEKRVVELDDKQQEVWSYGEGLEHPLSAQRLANGNTLIGDAKLGKVIEVTPAKKVVWKYEAENLSNMRMRNSRRTAQNTTLIAEEAIAKILEVDASGKVIWQWQAPNGAQRRAYQAIRLANGNTLVSISDPGEVVEVAPNGSVVRSIAGTKMDLQFGWASGIAQMPNGNLLIVDYTGRRVVEVDPKGKLVNEMRSGERTFASIDVVK
ncbi:alpha/beta hydrolase fold domain-containing protein [Bryobacter aggregatus]|uniref:alpha/beta hydrolase fold domain-containing protein n=1 Tax=Bryobacter aggregatus TaxID=360054 RepID=UPI0012BB0CEA|nr:alpha/beta hydrolase fold domain-containing protein [Bryobacter aggregatus]